MKCDGFGTTDDIYNPNCEGCTNCLKSPTLDLPAEHIRLTKALDAMRAERDSERAIAESNLARYDAEHEIRITAEDERDAAIAALAEEASTVERMTGEAWRAWVQWDTAIDAWGDSDDPLVERSLVRCRAAVRILEQHPSYKGP